MKFLKIQVLAKVAGVTVAPSAKLPLKGSAKIGGVTVGAETIAAQLLKLLDMADGDGGVIDGDADQHFKATVKVPIVGSVDIEGDITLSIAD